MRLKKVTVNKISQASQRKHLYKINCTKRYSAVQYDYMYIIRFKLMIFLPLTHRTMQFIQIHMNIASLKATRACTIVMGHGTAC